MIGRLTEVFWPTREDWRPAELSEIRNSNRDEADDIRSTDWSVESDLALEEARRLGNAEEDRRKTAESKASHLLMVAAALVPIFTSLETAIWDAKLGTAPKWISLPLLAVAVLYLCWSALWALRAMATSNYRQVYHSDLVCIWKEGQGGPEIRRRLAAETFLASRMNQDTINSKITCSTMGHAFLFRAIIAFSVLLLVQAGFELWTELAHR
jgi:hypothetical protein